MKGWVVNFCFFFIIIFAFGLVTVISGFESSVVILSSSFCS